MRKITLNRSLLNIVILFNLVIAVLLNPLFAFTQSGQIRIAQVDSVWLENALTDATVYPAIWYSYLSSAFQDPTYPSWDTLTVDYVVASAMKDTTQDDNLYYLDADGVTVLDDQQPESNWATKAPVWELVYILDYENGFEWWDPVARPGAGYCACYSSNTGGSKCGDSSSKGCGERPCSYEKCTFFQRIGTWLHKE